jgi:uncharacterized cysteine cluster protein YcgN (CxxCxxCC family)
MKSMSRERWEAICTKCGKCCYEKVDLGGGIIEYTDVPCVHLDPETKLCRVYEKRHEVEPDCISLTEDLVRVLNWLPEDCAYVEYVGFQDTMEAVAEAQERKKRKRKDKRRR